jgi:hypothetical protein
MVRWQISAAISLPLTASAEAPDVDLDSDVG